jgi:hypothetical protein
MLQIKVRGDLILDNMTSPQLSSSKAGVDGCLAPVRDDGSAICRFPLRVSIWSRYPPCICAPRMKGEITAQELVNAMERESGQCHSARALKDEANREL